MRLLKDIARIVADNFTVRRGGNGSLAVLLAGGCLMVALVNLIIIMAK